MTSAEDLLLRCQQNVKICHHQGSGPDQLSVLEHEANTIVNLDFFTFNFFWIQTIFMCNLYDRYMSRERVRYLSKATKPELRSLALCSCALFITMLTLF